MKSINIASIGVLVAAVASAATPATAYCQQRSAALEEVVVTAQKRPEGYLDVPVSVSTLSGEVLDMAKVSEFQDLVQVSPSLTFSQTGDQRGVGVLIRGIGTTAFQTAVEPTVATVVDGITMGRTVQFVSDLDDIERVEILRGPQGTLFGKNASGGLIAIHTKNPTQAFKGRIRASYSDDEASLVSGVVSGGLSDSVRGRLAFYAKSFDGWGENVYTGNTINGDESWGARLKLAVDISERASLMLTGDYSEQDRNCCTPMIYDTEGPLSPLINAEYAAYGIDLKAGNTKTLDAQDDFSNTETWGTSAALTLDLDRWRFISVTGYRGFTLQSNQGVEGRPYAGSAAALVPGLFFDSNGAYAGVGNGTPGGDQSQTQFSQEFRLESQAWESTNVLLGLFYWDQSVERYFERVSVFGIRGLNFGGIGWLDSEVNTKSWAAFGQVNYALNDAWTVIAGLRYTDDQIDVAYDKVTSKPGAAVTPGSAASSDTTETDVSGKLGLQYNPSENWMWYATATTGYKSPGFDLIFDVTPARIENPVPAETVVSFELGTKAEFWDRRARLGATLFHSTFDNLQEQALTSDGLAFQLTSAGSAVTQGLEIDLTLKPQATWLINMGYAYTDASYDDYADAPCYPGQTAAQGCSNGAQVLTGRQIANAPRNKFTAQTRYDFDIGGSWMPYVGGAYRYQSGSGSDLNSDPRTYRQSYGVLDLIAGIAAVDQRWSAEFFVKNATDEFYIDRPIYTPFQGTYGAYLTRDAWRYMGIELNYQFGAQ